MADGQEVKSPTTLILDYLNSKGWKPTNENVRRALEAAQQDPGAIPGLRSDTADPVAEAAAEAASSGGGGSRSTRAPTGVPAISAAPAVAPVVAPTTTAPAPTGNAPVVPSPAAGAAAASGNGNTSAAPNVAPLPTDPPIVPPAVTQPSPNEVASGTATQAPAIPRGPIQGPDQPPAPFDLGNYISSQYMPSTTTQAGIGLSGALGVPVVRSLMNSPRVGGTAAPLGGWLPPAALQSPTAPVAAPAPAPSVLDATTAREASGGPEVAPLETHAPGSAANQRPAQRYTGSDVPITPAAPLPPGPQVRAPVSVVRAPAAPAIAPVVPLPGVAPVPNPSSAIPPAVLHGRGPSGVLPEDLGMWAKTWGGVLARNLARVGKYARP